MNCDFFLSFCLSELQDDLCSDLSNLQNWLSRNFVSPLFPCPSNLFLLLLLSQFDHRDTRKKARKLPCKSWGELKTYVRRGDEKIAVSNFSNLHRMQSLQIHFLGPKNRLEEGQIDTVNINTHRLRDAEGIRCGRARGRPKRPLSASVCKFFSREYSGISMKVLPQFTHRSLHFNSHIFALHTKCL